MRIIHYAIVLCLICVAAAFGVAGVFKVTHDVITAKETARKVAAQGSVVGLIKTPGFSLEMVEPEEGRPEQVVNVLDRRGKVILSFVIPAGGGVVKVRDETGAMVASLVEAESRGDSGERVVEVRDASGGKVLGYAAEGAAQGYGDKIRVIVGIDPDGGKITGVMVVSQKETPGLGTQVIEVKTSKSWVGLISGRGGGEEEEPMPWFLEQFVGLRAEEVALTSQGGNVQGITGATVSSEATVNAVRDAVAKIRALGAEQGARAAPEGRPGATPRATEGTRDEAGSGQRAK